MPLQLSTFFWLRLRFIFRIFQSLFVQFIEAGQMTAGIFVLEFAPDEISEQAHWTWSSLL